LFRPPEARAGGMQVFYSVEGVDAASRRGPRSEAPRAQRQVGHGFLRLLSYIGASCRAAGDGPSDALGAGVRAISASVHQFSGSRHCRASDVVGKLVESSTAYRIIQETMDRAHGQVKAAEVRCNGQAPTPLPDNRANFLFGFSGPQAEIFSPGGSADRVVVRFLLSVW